MPDYPPTGELIEDMPEYVYHSDPFEVPTLNASTARYILDKSAAHAYDAHPRLGGAPARHSQQFDFGKHGHKLLLKKGSPLAPVYIENTKKGVTPETWATTNRAGRLFVHDADGELMAEAEPADSEAILALGFRAADSFRTKAAKAAQDYLRGAGRIPVLKRDETEMSAMANKWRAKLLNHKDRYGKPEPISFDGISECVLSWHSKTEDGHDVLCRAMLDHVHVFAKNGRPYGAIIDDVKTGKDAHPSMCERKIFSLGSYIQRTAYREGLSKVLDIPEQHIRFRWISVEISRVAAVNVSEADESTSHLGEHHWMRAKGIWHKCNASGEWPDYSGRTHIVSAPMWKMRELEEEYE